MSLVLSRVKGVGSPKPSVLSPFALIDYVEGFTNYALRNDRLEGLPVNTGRLHCLPKETQRDGSLHKLPQKGFQSESISKALQDGVGEIL